MDIVDSPRYSLATVPNNAQWNGPTLHDVNGPCDIVAIGVLDSITFTASRHDPHWFQRSAITIQLLRNADSDALKRLRGLGNPPPSTYPRPPQHAQADVRTLRACQHLSEGCLSSTRHLFNNREFTFNPPPSALT